MKGHTPFFFLFFFFSFLFFFLRFIINKVGARFKPNGHLGLTPHDPHLVFACPVVCQSLVELHTSLLFLGPGRHEPLDACGTHTWRRHDNCVRNVQRCARRFVGTSLKLETFRSAKAFAFGWYNYFDFYFCLCVRVCVCVCVLLLLEEEQVVCAPLLCGWRSI